MEGLVNELKDLIAEEIRKEIERRLSLTWRNDIYGNVVSLANYYYSLTGQGQKVWRDLYDAANEFESDEDSWCGDNPVQKFLRLVDDGDVTDFNEPVTLDVSDNFVTWEGGDEIVGCVVDYIIAEGIVDSSVEVFDGEEYTTIETAKVSTAVSEVLEMARRVGEDFYIESVKVREFVLVAGGLL